MFVLSIVIASSGPARAFVDPAQFFADAANPHGATLGAVAEGVYFTGAPRFAGLDCSSCHRDGTQRVSVHLGATPEGLFTEGYKPGTTYQILVELVGETEGRDLDAPTCTVPPAPSDKYDYVPCNNNGFALEIDDGNGPLGGTGVFCAGAPVGGACPSPDLLHDATVVAPNGDAVFGNRARDPGNPKIILANGNVAWRFYFTAPPAGRGPLTLYLGAVDGAGGDGTADNDQDPYGDDTVRATVPIREADATGGLDAVAGCGLARARPAQGVVGAAALALLLAIRRRRQRGW